MKTWMLMLVCLAAGLARATAADVPRTPPMGWNSYDAFGDSVTEDEVMANAVYLNFEVLAVNQDALCRPAARVWQKDGLEVWTRELAGGAKAVGLFNRGAQPAEFNQLGGAGVTGDWHIRDLWQQQDLPGATAAFSATIPAHGSRLLKLNPAK
jgi:alpha-galactosidase